jgi:drug/metabolite transporter (DMT)-like permease
MNLLNLLPFAFSGAAPFGFGIAASWGVGDFVTTHAARKFPFGVVTLLLISYLPATFVLTLALPGGPANAAQLVTHLSVTALLLLVVIALLETIGHLMLYTAFSRGPLALVAPIGTASPAVAAILALGFGYHANPVLLAGAGLLLASAALASIERARASANTMDVGTPQSRSQWGLWKTPGVKPAIGAALLQGSGFFLLLYLPHSLNSVTTSWLIFAVSVLFLVGVIAVARVRGRGRQPQQLLAVDPVAKARASGLWVTYGQLVLSGTLDGAAFLFYAAGQRTGEPVLLAGLASLATVITVLLAVVLLREGLSWPQRAGVVCAVVGLVLASIGGAL